MFCTSDGILSLFAHPPGLFLLTCFISGKVSHGDIIKTMYLGNIQHEPKPAFGMCQVWSSIETHTWSAALPAHSSVLLLSAPYPPFILKAEPRKVKHTDSNLLAAVDFLSPPPC